MQMIRYVLLGVVLVFTLSFLTACETGDDREVRSPWQGGMHGLVGEFDVEAIGTVGEGRQRASVWSDESFPVLVEFENLGEYTIPANKVEMEIVGISENDFSGLTFNKDNTEEIRGVTERFDGGIYYADFGDARYNELSGSQHTSTIALEYTYPYETYINIPRVCYSYDVRDDSICRVDSSRRAFSSGGPIRVKSVEQSFIGRDKMMLEIKVEHVGADSARMKSRESDSFDDRQNEAYFTVDDPDWDCRSRQGETNVVRIRSEGDQEGTIRCTYENLEEGANHVSALQLDLEYYYKDRTSMDVTIKDPY
ncbi:MAG: hypothetical protein ACOCZQ_00110 [Nanoarchaeota archaeon]